MNVALFLFMHSKIFDIFRYNSISGSRVLYATIGRDRISLVMRPALAEDLTQEDTMGIQTNPRRVTICHVPPGDPNRHAISAGTYAVSEHVREYSDYLTSSIFLTQHS
jgi:hypothetical protein